MVRYELGKEYEFEFVGKDLHQDSDGTHYFRVKDDESQYLIRAFDYQWDYDAIPNVFVCKVISTSPFIIEQAKSFLLRERYPIPKESVFSVYSILNDNKSQSKYYRLKDAFGLFHRYYPKKDEVYKIGDNIKLWVGGVKQETGGGAHLELSSCAVSQDKGCVSPICSNLGDAQARRLKIRVKGEDGKMYLPHTLNNTVVAPPRMLIAFLENHLQADGSVTIPEVLRPYMGGKDTRTTSKSKRSAARKSGTPPEFCSTSLTRRSI